jgi:hypothetical protein
MFAALVSSCLPIMLAGPSQFFPTGSGTNLSSVEYFGPPNEQQVKLRLTGAEMTSLPGTLYEVKKLKIEQFGTNGVLESVAEAPECTYAPLDGIASSPGHLEMSLGEGKIHVQGEGFLWQQNDMSLVISNQQHTVIKMGTWKLPTP